MGIIAWIVLGALAGWITSMIMGTNEKQGCIGNIVVGIVGAFIGGFVLNSFMNDGSVTGFNLWSIFVAVLGSVILLFILGLIKGKK